MPNIIIRVPDNYVLWPMWKSSNKYRLWSHSFICIIDFSIYFVAWFKLLYDTWIRQGNRKTVLWKCNISIWFMLTDIFYIRTTYLLMYLHFGQDMKKKFKLSQYQFFLCFIIHFKTKIAHLVLIIVIFIRRAGPVWLLTYYYQFSRQWS